MDPYQKRKVKGKNIQNTKWMDSGGFRLAFLFVIFFPEGKVINRSQSNLSNCVIEFNPVHSAHYFRPESRSSTRSLSRQSGKCWIIALKYTMYVSVLYKVYSKLKCSYLTCAAVYLSTLLCITWPHFMYFRA